MFWADKIARKIIDSGKYKPLHVDDMKTPSGRIHVGALRGVLIHDFIQKALLQEGQESQYTYVFNDMDPMDGLPNYLDKEVYEKEMGKPLFKIPAPDGKSENFAVQYANEFLEAMRKLGANCEIVWSHELYESGKMNEVIREALEKVGEIRKIYQEVAGYEKPEGWYPFQVICPQCGKVGTTVVDAWDGEKVHFKCQENLVVWAKGCGFEGEISPFDGRGKLMWKVDWPAHWKVIGVTIEGAGKDHCSAGGSRDMANEIVKQVFNYEIPFNIPYEWFLIEGKKMSSSKGVGASAIEFSKVLPAELGRFLFARTHYNKQMNFNPEGMTIPDLFDEYDRCAEAYFEKGNEDDFGRIYEMSQVKKDDWQKKRFLPRFLDIAKALQDPKIDLVKLIAKKKGGELNDLELEILEERKTYVAIWLENYAPSDLVVKVVEDVPEVAKNLSGEQKRLLYKVAQYLDENKGKLEEQVVQNFVYQTGKEMGLKPKLAFQAVYLALLGKEHGPKAGALILSQDVDFVIERFKGIVELKMDGEKKIEKVHPIWQREDLFTISPNFKQKYPSANIGIALIKGVKVQLETEELEEYKRDFFMELGQISRDIVTNSKNLNSYKRLYREMGVDWHKRMPSPLALRHRLIQKKDFPSVNTVVDCYNLVVIKNEVSVGAFDFDKIEFPCILKEASGGESSLYIGEKEETVLQEGEIAYFDQVGPYNLDYNYRDSIRTQVVKETTNLWINVEGIYDIGQDDVAQTLEEAIELITRFCGGKVEEMGIC